MKKWLLACITIFIVVAAIAFTVKDWIDRKIPPWPPYCPGVSLVSSRPLLPTLEPGNGVYHFEKLILSAVEDGIDFEEHLRQIYELQRGETTPELEVFFAENRLWEEFEAATDCTFWQARSVTNSRQNVVEVGVPMIRFFGINSYRMERAANAGEWKELEDLARRHLIAAHGTGRGGNFVAMAVMYAGENYLLRSLSSILATTNPPPETLAFLDELLERGVLAREPLEEILRMEWIATSNLIHSISPPSRPRSMNKTERLIGSLWSYMIHECSDPFGPDTAGDWVQQDIGIGPLMKMVRLSMPPASFQKTRYKDAIIRKRYQATVLLIALERYQQEHGIVPETLSELVPQYIDELPIDFCSPEQKPIRYQKQEGNQFRLYLLGENRIDDGGDPKLDVLISPK